jgi:hypothetical protein
MSDICKALFLSAAMLTSAGCAMHGPGGVASSTDSKEMQPAVGGTTGTAGGSVSGGGNSLAPEKKEERATPPVGTSRDGSGPAAGAILDPTGAATRGRP